MTVRLEVEGVLGQVGESNLDESCPKTSLEEDSRVGGELGISTRWSRGWTRVVSRERVTVEGKSFGSKRLSAGPAKDLRDTKVGRRRRASVRAGGGDRDSSSDEKDDERPWSVRICSSKES